MQNPASVLENDTHKILWDFSIQTDQLIPAQKTRPYNYQQQEKRICKIVDFALQADHRINMKEYEKKDKYLAIARELKKVVEHESNDFANCNRCFRHNN